MRYAGALKKISCRLVNWRGKSSETRDTEYIGHRWLNSSGGETRDKMSTENYHAKEKTAGANQFQVEKTRHTKVQPIHA